MTNKAYVASPRREDIKKINEQWASKPKRTAKKRRKHNNFGDCNWIRPDYENKSWYKE